MKKKTLRYSIGELFASWVILKILKLKASPVSTTVLTKLLNNPAEYNETSNSFKKEDIKAAYGILIYRNEYELKFAKKDLQTTKDDWVFNKASKIEKKQRYIDAIQERIDSFKKLRDAL